MSLAFTNGVPAGNAQVDGLWMPIMFGGLLGLQDCDGLLC